MRIKGYKKEDSLLKNHDLDFGVFFKVALFSAVVVGFAYVFQMGSIVAQGYQLSELQETNKGLTDGNQALKTQISGLTSFTHLADVTKALQMVPADQVVYLTSADRPALAEATRSNY